MKRMAAFMMCYAIGVSCMTGCVNRNELLIQKSFTTESEAVTDICIDVRDRKIEVSSSDDNKIHIDYFENSKEYYDISVTDGHTLTMYAGSKKNCKDYIGGKSAASARNISLRLPDSLLASLKLSTTNEDISLSSLNVCDLSLSSHGGNIVFDKLNVGNSIHLDSKNGNISGTIIGSYDDYAISCNRKKGRSNLPSFKENGVKTLTVLNNNGDIDIEFIRE